MRTNPLWSVPLATLLGIAGVAALPAARDAPQGKTPAKKELTGGVQKPGEEVTGEKFKPKWQVGDQWVVETRTDQVQFGADPKQKPAAKPIPWQFTVQEPKPSDPKDCIRVEVKCMLGENQPTTILWADKRSLALRQVQTQLPVQGELRTVVESYQFGDGAPSPVMGPLTALPLDLPLFLAGEPKNTQKFFYEAISGPNGTKAVGDLGFSYEVEQKITQPKPLEVKDLLHEDFAKDLKTQPIVEVKLIAVDREVRQLWQPGQPWPVYTHNGLTEARLVRVTRAGRQP